MKKRIIIVLIALIMAATIFYMAGPHPAKPSYSIKGENLLVKLNDLDSYVAFNEKKYAPLKPGNEAKIVWFNDSIKEKTPYALVYLHGFSASHEEGNPIHEWMAKKYGMNLYLARLADHGRASADALSQFTAQIAWNDAVHALDVGKLLGDKVILMSTSTGGTLSLMLTALDQSIYGQILMSPNIAINDSKAWLLNDRWGLQIARKVIGGDYRYAGDSMEPYINFWDHKYRIEALPQLEELIESSMLPATFHAVKQPTLLLYYYKDELHQDDVVRVDAMLNMYDQLGTPIALKHKVALPTVGSHVMGSYVKSKDLEVVKYEIQQFAESTLHLIPRKL